MAIIKCPNCSNNLSDKAKKCPGCGDIVNFGDTSGHKRKILKMIAIPLIIIIVILTATFFYMVQFQSVKDFRNAKWGMTIEDVKKIEKRQIITETERAISYSVNDFLGKWGAVVLYNFDNGELYEGVCMLSEKFDSQKEYQNAFQEIEQDISKTFGESTVDDKNGVLIREWKTKDEKIVLLCSTIPENNSVAVTYTQIK